VATAVTHPLPVPIEEITRQPRVHNGSLFSGRFRFFQNPERPKRYERPAGSLRSVSNCGAVKFTLRALLRDLN